ncbi:MAG: hypothetical protein Q8P18_17285 [Pseudomonadota bacterium]|nr:hypothetical protein [Pseudomonadota bacterium]
MPSPSLLLALVLAAPAGHAAPAAPSTQAVRFEVVSGGSFPALHLSLTARWLGVDRTVELRDDGVAPDPLAGDHHFTAELVGEPVRALPVRITGTADGIAPFVAYASIEKVSAEGDHLTWSLDLDDPPNARRVALAQLTRSVMASDMTWVAATLGWANFALVYVAWLGQRWLRSLERR